jgi:hypothetical protein
MPDVVSITSKTHSKVPYLRFVENFLRDFICKHLRWFRLLQDLILAYRQESLEQVLRQRETDNKLLPREQRPVEEMRKTLWIISYTFLSDSISIHTCNKSILPAFGEVPRKESLDTGKQCLGMRFSRG